MKKNKNFMLIRVNSGFAAFLERWCGSTSYKNIGWLYALSGSSSIIGAVLSLTVQLKLFVAGGNFLEGGSQLYNTIVTAHALIMIFFWVMPTLIGGFDNWLVPVMIGAPNMAFIRINNLSFWLLPIALCLLIFSAFTNQGVGTGWTLHPFLSSLIDHYIPGVDLGIFVLYLIGNIFINIALTITFTIFWLWLNFYIFTTQLIERFRRLLSTAFDYSVLLSDEENKKKPFSEKYPEKRSKQRHPINPKYYTLASAIASVFAPCLILYENISSPNSFFTIIHILNGYGLSSPYLNFLSAFTIICLFLLWRARKKMLEKYGEILPTYLEKKYNLDFTCLPLSYANTNFDRHFHPIVLVLELILFLLLVPYILKIVVFPHQLTGKESMSYTIFCHVYTWITVFTACTISSLSFIFMFVGF